MCKNLWALVTHHLISVYVKKGAKNHVIPKQARNVLKMISQQCRVVVSLCELFPSEIFCSVFVFNGVQQPVSLYLCNYFLRSFETEITRAFWRHACRMCGTRSGRRSKWRRGPCCLGFALSACDQDEAGYVTKICDWVLRVGPCAGPRESKRCTHFL